MISLLQEHLDKILNIYSMDDHRDTLLEAKKIYFEKTGAIHDDDPDYESRMRCFNDWYISSFISSKGTTTVIKDYVNNHNIEEDISDSLLNIHHSLFVFSKKTFSKKMIVKDILHKNKYTLDKDSIAVGLVEGDLFTGRILSYEGKNFLLSGVCLYPKEVEPILEKRSKVVRKKKEPLEDYKFLMKLEALKTKWQRYGHVGLDKIFTFSE